MSHCKRRPRLIIFASGSEKAGGSGFQNLVLASRDGRLEADIVGVVSNHREGGVQKRAERLSVPFIHSPKPRTGEDYARIVSIMKADFTALSGWLGLVQGLDPCTTFNIHPAWLPSPYGGRGFHGHHVHEAVLADFRLKKVLYHGVTMHFVTEKYDDPDGIFFRRKVEILEEDTVETLAARVNQMEHKWQPLITNLVVTRRISWDGGNGFSVIGSDIE